MVSLTIGQKKSRTMKNVSGLYVPVYMYISVTRCQIAVMIMT